MKYYVHHPKKVALIGMGPSITDVFNDTLTQEAKLGWVDEVWAINMACNAFRHDVVFWMDDLKEQQKFRPELMLLLNKYGSPVITSKSYPDIVPNSYDYPIQEVSTVSFSIFGAPYFNNGVAMALAYALVLGVREFKIFGCDFTYPNRNFAESGRACVEAWITLALTRGMSVQLAPHTSLMDNVSQTGIYGYAEQPELMTPTGARFKFIKNEKDPHEGYKPEDSSGKETVNERSEVRTEAGTGVESNSSKANGGNGTAHKAGLSQKAATRRSRKGIRRGNSKGRDKKRNPPGHVRGGIEGGFQEGADPALLSDEGKPET